VFEILGMMQLNGHAAQHRIDPQKRNRTRAENARWNQA
jgi:hypothetical protein